MRAAYLFCCLILSVHVFAQEEDITALLDVLDEETKTATEERTNADFLPGIITVLDGAEMEKAGMRTVWESLDLVPGFLTAYNNFGELTVGVRGLGYQQHYSFNKVFIDGIAVESTGEQRMAYLTLPVEQVERIEVLRGTGGVLFGADATAGVINIITRKNGSAAWVERGSFDTWHVGGRFSNYNKDRDLRVYLAANLLKTDGSATVVQNDAFTAANLGYAPGPIDDRDESRYFSAGVEWKGLSLEGRYIERLPGDFYGLDALPPRGFLDRGSDKFWHTAIQYDREWVEDLNGKIRFAYKRHDFLGEEHIRTPRGAVTRVPPGSPLANRPLPEDYVDRRAQDESRLEWFTEWVWSGWEQHNLLFQSQFSRLELEDSFIETVSPALVSGVQKGWLPIGSQRESFSLTAQDQWSLKDDLMVTFGLRFEDVSDIGTNWSPQFALAYRPWDPLTLKAQYTRGFREPSFLELYELNSGRARTLDAETVDIVDISAIYRTPATVFRITGFYQEFKDLISRRNDTTGALIYSNRDQVDSYGVELEWSHDFTSWLELSGNLSWIHTNDISDRPIPGMAQYLGHIQTKLTPHKNVEAIFRWRYVDDVQNYLGPPVAGTPDRLELAEIPAYNFFDAILNFPNWPVSSMSIQLGVRNLFNQEAQYLSSPVVRNNASIYPEGLPAHPREWYVQIKYEF